MVATERQPRPAPKPSAGARALIVEARYYQGISDELLAGARAALEAAGASVEVITVPGALEVPVAMAMVLESAAEAGEPYDLAVALGCVIRGETGHYDIVAGESARGLMDVSLELRIPIGNGILTVDTEEQAWARARVAEMDKGGGAAAAAMTVLQAVRALEGRARG